ncbi:type II toxin-antitoxin system RelE/ParE family toxin [Lacipirellula sp.]|uniref:type II toxin-antitoxin system RelE/ParE family toxin n=1 Tax=Lacipirellula sp. TaxID=2691419 RepID=UPI003D0C0E29
MKVRRLDITQDAENDLDGIFSFIARDKPVAALHFVQRLRRRCLPLTKNPFVGEDCSEFGPGMRRLSYQSYLIFFRIDDDAVTILRVAHGARDLTELF